MSTPKIQVLGKLRGENGVSPTIVVSEVAEGTEISVTNADGTTSSATIPNGKNGYTPEKGVDYYTPADEAEWSEYIASELAKRGQLKPEFANSIGECTDTSKLYVLPDGYIYAYTGKYVEGSITPNFTNRIPISTDTDGSIYDGDGFAENKYLSNGVPTSRSGIDCSGFSPIGSGTSQNAVNEQVIRFEGMTAPKETTTRIAFYKSDKSFITQFYGSMLDTNGYDFPVPNETDDNGNLIKIDITGITAHLRDEGLQGETAYFRISCPNIDSNSIITVNEEITYTTAEGGIVYEWTNTGHAFVPADYEDRIIQLEAETKQLKADLESAEQRIETLENSKTSANAVPQAVIDGVSNLVDKSLSRADENVLRFIIYSDAHQYNENADITNGNIELGKAIGEVVNQIGVDFVSGIGDSAWAAYTNTAEEVRAQLKQFNRYVYPYIKGEQILNCEGNHDDAVYSTIDNDGDGTTSSAEKFSLAETFSLIYARNKNVVFDADHYLDGYCYKDFEHLKVRVICLNTEQGTGDGGVVEDYQLTWLEEVALDMTDKTDWQVITLAHHPFSFGTSSLNAVVEIINAFINGGGKYVAHFHGHAHAFSVVKMQRNISGIYTDIDAWEICIPNACYTRNNQYLGNANARLARYSTEITYAKTEEDGNRTAFNLVTIDLNNKIIYADNYGAGIDREISY